MEPTINTENNQMPSYDPAMQQQNKKKKPPYLWVAVGVILAAGLGLMWYYMDSDLDFVPQDGLNVQQSPSQDNFEAEVDSIDTGDLDFEFESIDSDLNTL